MKLAEWAVRNIRPIVFLTAMLCIAGAIIYQSFPVSILPDVTFPRVVVIAESGDRPTKMVEISITRPLEEAMATIPNVKRIRSEVKRGSTEISIDFIDGSDVMVAEQLVNARVNQMLPQLPPDTTTEVERMNATVFPVMGLTVNSKSMSQTDLWNLATYTLKPRLARAQGVARVSIQGGRPPEIEVEVKPGQLAAVGLSTSDIVQAIQTSNVVHSVGTLNQEYQRFHVIVNAEATTYKDIENITVSQKSGHAIRLYQVATVHPSTEDRTTIVSANGSESVLINLIRQPSANSASMVDAVNHELATMKPLLPKDVQIGVFYDQSVLIHEAVGSVRDAVLIGAVLAVFVLLLFLRDIRATLVTGSIIPVTLLITFLLMRLAGLTLNLMTLGALAVSIGLIIDDAIVVVECVFQNFSKSNSLLEAVKAASSQIAAPMISSTLTTVVVFLPLAFLQGVSGAFFSALALTLTISLMVSLVLALCVSPSLCAGFLKFRSGDHDQAKPMGVGFRIYEGVLGGLLRAKWLVAPIIALTLLGTWFVANKLQTGFMPAIDEGSFVLDYWSPPGSSLEESDRLLKKVDDILLSTPEVETFSRRTGTEMGFAITESNRGDYAIMLKPNRKRNIDQVIAEVRSKVQEQVGGLDVEFVQVLQDLIGDLAGNPNPIEIKLFGENKQNVEEAAKTLAEKIGKIKGLVDAKSGVVESGPEVQFVPDPASMGRHGISNDQVSDQLNASLFGTVATKVIQGDRQIPVRVRFPIATRSDLESIKRIGIQTSAGKVLLKDLGDVVLVPGTTQGFREDQLRLVTVTAGLENVDLGTAVAGVRKVLKESKFPSGVRASLAGQFLNQEESFANLELVLGTSVLLVFTVMLFQFRSFQAPLVVLILMPLSLFGAVIALFITGTALNVSSFMGVIMLAGIVVKNGILLLDRAQNLIADGKTPNEAVLEAVHARLRPILMTTLTAILGLLPLAFGLGAGAEMQKPLAIAVVGGLAFSTLLTLLIGPVLYSAFMTRSAAKQK